MPDFDIDSLKKTWQEQEFPPKYDHNAILEMLNRRSRNNVKLIFWISVAEFLFFLGLTIFYLFQSDDSDSFKNILSRLGIEITSKIEMDFAHLYFALKILSLLVTGFFIVRFYMAYQKINVESNLKRLIKQIISFRKVVNQFIITNILLLVFFTTLLTVFILWTLSQQQVHLDSPTLIGFIIGIVISTLLCVFLIWIYYRLVYGIILRKLGKVLDQLREMDGNENV